MKKKGFTLIELLAVIVVLAIIALIATPIVLNLINKAKEGAAKSSATAYVKAVENGVVQELLNSNDQSYTGRFEIDSTGLKLRGENNCKTIHDEKYNIDIVKCPEITVDVSGKLPESGSYVLLDENGTVTNGYFTIDNYYIVYSNGVAKVLSNKEKEQETLKMIDNLNIMLNSMEFDTSYEEYHCFLNSWLNDKDNNIYCHYEGMFEINIKKTFDMSKYGLDGIMSESIFYNTKTKKITKVNINGFGYQDGKLGSYFIQY